MTRLQLRVLYRQFLFRMVDLEVLSAHAQGDSNKLLGQCAALLVFLGWVQSLGALLFSGAPMTPQQRLVALWSKQHSLIAMTMVAVGLFAVLSWDSCFPDRRDVLVLAPLPVRPRTLLLAKIAALGVALGLTVAALNALSGIAWPILFMAEGSGVAGVVRSVAAYWLTMLAAGAFVFCSVLGVEGLAAQLPRRLFLRVSGILQLGAFCLFVSVYLLEPGLVSPHALADPHNQPVLAALPTYWFFAVFHALNGSMRPIMVPLAHRALAGLAIAFFASASAFLLSYFRTLRRVVEEPDIMPGHRGVRWLPRFGSAFETAIVQFSIRTLLRSRQHRVILAFYLGIGFAIVTVYMKSPLAMRQLSRHEILPLLVASTLAMCFAVLGTRVVMAMPLDLRGNWIFRITAVRGTPECLAASRRSLLALSVIPAWAVSATVLISIWPWWLAAAHLAVLAMAGLILADLCLHGFHKIPFTCSYLPGKSNLNMACLIGYGLLLVVAWLVQYERDALGGPAAYARLLAILALGAAAARGRTAASAKEEDASVRFEDVMPPAVQVLGLTRDGVTLLP